MKYNVHVWIPVSVFRDVLIRHDIPTSRWSRLKAGMQQSQSYWSTGMNSDYAVDADFAFWHPTEYAIEKQEFISWSFSTPTEYNRRQHCKASQIKYTCV